MWNFIIFQNLFKFTKCSRFNEKCSQFYSFVHEFEICSCSKIWSQFKNVHGLFADSKNVHNVLILFMKLKFIHALKFVHNQKNITVSKFVQNSKMSKFYNFVHDFEICSSFKICSQFEKCSQFQNLFADSKHVCGFII